MKSNIYLPQLDCVLTMDETSRCISVEFGEEEITSTKLRKVAKEIDKLQKETQKKEWEKFLED